MDTESLRIIKAQLLSLNLSIVALIETHPDPAMLAAKLRAIAQKAEYLAVASELDDETIAMAKQPVQMFADLSDPPNQK